MKLSNELIDRINELAQKQREETLTEEEKKEQAELRQEYVEQFSNRMRSTLNTITVLEELEIGEEDSLPKEKILEIEGVDNIALNKVYYNPKKIERTTLIEKIAELKESNE